VNPAALQQLETQTGLDAALSAANSVLSSAALAEPTPTTCLVNETHVPSGLLSAFSNASNFSSATESLRSGSRAGYGAGGTAPSGPQATSAQGGSTASQGGAATGPSPEAQQQQQQQLQQQQQQLQQQQEIILFQQQLLQQQTQSQQQLLQLQHQQEQQQLIQQQQVQLQQLQVQQLNQTAQLEPNQEDGEDFAAQLSNLTVAEEGGLPAALPSAPNSGASSQSGGQLPSLPTALGLPSSGGGAGRLPGFDLPSSTGMPFSP